MSTLASPCVNVCVMDEATGLCRGCHRTLDEIARWSIMSDAEKRRVVTWLAQREQHQKGSDPCG